MLGILFTLSGVGCLLTCILVVILNIRDRDSAKKRSESKESKMWFGMDASPEAKNTNNIVSGAFGIVVSLVVLCAGIGYLCK